MKNKIDTPLFRLFCATIFLWTYTISVSAQQPDTKVTLGIKPDYWNSAGSSGVRAKDVIPGRTAILAGVKAGDVILAFDHHPVKNIFTYRDLLFKYKPGDKVRLKVKRGKELLYLNAVFD